MIKKLTPETDAFFLKRGVWSDEILAFCRKLERERDEAREERNKLKSLNESYAACWDEIKDALNESEQGDKTCDLDRVLKAIRERDELRELHKKSLREREAAERESDATLERAHRAERERDEARESLKHITEYGTEEINAAIDLRQKLASALIERDEARERCSKLEKAMSYSSGATTLLSRFLKVLNERNGLIQKMDAWEEIAEHLHHLVLHPAYGVDQAIRRMDVLEAYKHLKNGH